MNGIGRCLRFDMNVSLTIPYLIQIPITIAGNSPVDKNTISQINDLADIGKTDNTGSYSVSSMTPQSGIKIGCKIIENILAIKFIS